jgi:serine/threonine-protein kinase
MRADTFFDGGGDEAAETIHGTDPSTRFEVRGTLGAGGMGEVLLVWDPVLAREVALKVAHAHLVHHSTLRQRFVEEAQIQARLQHPNLVPVHELGRMPDGRPWFTMDVIRGEAFHLLVHRVHTASSAGAWATTEDGWSLHRLVATLAQACRAVAFAHGLGIVHRDLKPQNLMVGDFGEVRVVDWGLARAAGAVAPAAGPLPTPAADDGATVMLAGADASPGGVSGTPSYMAPEQAAGHDALVDARADVYALGAVLYELVAGRPPYTGSASTGPRELLSRVLAGPPPPLAQVAPVPVPEELAAVVARAMARDRASRYPEAGALADALQAWLDGSRRRAHARELVARADATRSQAQAHRRHAHQLRTTAEKTLASVARWADDTDKAEAWALEDRATELEREADLLDARRIQAYQAALAHAPESPEAHAALVTHHKQALADAESSHETAKAAIAALHLRQHLDALPVGHPSRAPGLAWLEGQGTLTLHVATPGASMRLERLELRKRRLVAVEGRELGSQPLREFPLAMGSWLLRVRAPGHADVRYPVAIGRGERWDDTHPLTGEPAPLVLPPAGALGDDECFVPGGWFMAGGDPRAPGTPLSRRRVWVDSFVVARHPVTHGAYIRFLDALVAAGREDEALRHAPRLMGASPGELGPLLYAYADGRFSLTGGTEGDRWSPDTPVVLIDWHGANAYAAWHAATTGTPWRLLDELEREKAARGVDGRIYPWGDAFDPSWCCMRDSHAGKPRPSPVDGFPTDASVYGVRGVAGNVLDWTRTGYLPDGHVPDGGALDGEGADVGGRRVTRGGSWNDAASSGRCATRYNVDPAIRLNFIGFRLARTPA